MVKHSIAHQTHGHQILLGDEDTVVGKIRLSSLCEMCVLIKATQWEIQYGAMLLWLWALQIRTVKPMPLSRWFCICEMLCLDS